MKPDLTLSQIKQVMKEGDAPCTSHYQPMSNGEPTFNPKSSPVSVDDNSCGVSVSPSKTECVITPREPQEPTVEEESEYENLASWWMKRKELEAYD